MAVDSLLNFADMTSGGVITDTGTMSLPWAINTGAALATGSDYVELDFDGTTGSIITPDNDTLSNKYNGVDTTEWTIEGRFRTEVGTLAGEDHYLVSWRDLNQSPTTGIIVAISNANIVVLAGNTTWQVNLTSDAPIVAGDEVEFAFSRSADRYYFHVNGVAQTAVGTYAGTLSLVGRQLVLGIDSTNIDPAIGQLIRYRMTSGEALYSEGVDYTVDPTPNYGTDPTPPVAVAPTVDAGGPYNGLQNTAIQLTGTVTPGTDPAPTYVWSSNPATGSFDNANILTPLFTPSGFGAYTLTLTVSTTDTPDVIDTASLTSVQAGTTGQATKLNILTEDGWKQALPILNDHTEAHTLYTGTTHTDVTDTNPPALRDLLEYTGADWQPGRRTRYIEEGYVSGASYQIGDEVSNGSQISEAIVDGAVESPYVTPIGEPRDVYLGTIGNINAPAAKLVYFGNRYTFDEGGYITSYRLYTITGQTYNVFLTVDPLEVEGPKTVTQVASLVAASTGWSAVAISPVLVPSGVTFDLSARTSGTGSVPTALPAEYVYTTPQNLGVPAAGEISHGRSQPDVMRVAYTDNNTNDITTELNSLGLGDTIEDGSGIEWSIQSATPGTATIGYVQFTVTPAITGNAGTRIFTFNTEVDQPIDVGQDLNYWTSNPPEGATIQGLYIVEDLYDNITPDDSAYGLDISVQEAYIPTEWAVKVLSEGGSISGGGGFVPTEFQGQNTTGYVPDSVGNTDDAVMFADGSWGLVESRIDGGDENEATSWMGDRVVDGGVVT